MLPTLTLPAISKETLYVPGIFAFDANSGQPSNPTTLPVYYAFVGFQVDPGNSDWIVASWVTWTASDGATAAYLINPGSLAKASYDVWVRVVGSTEEPRRHVCTLIVT